ncbi:MAG: amino acid adenylation domain-containing protein [Vicinamibacterales bacterium]
MDTIPAQVRTAAATRLDQCAVLTDTSRLTYGELARRSQQVARRLHATGVGPGTVVAVSMTRSTDLVVALLAVLETGAAYLPIDPRQPEARRRALQVDAGVTRELTDAVWEALADEVGRRDDDAPRGMVGPTAEDLAYVIYTSGSTGHPKGVEVPHGAVSNFIASMQRRPGLSAVDRVLAHTTLSFDIHVLEIWATLAAGGTVLLVTSETAADPTVLIAAIERHQPTVIQATPALWSLLIANGWQPRPGLTALSGGEPLTRDLAAALTRTGARLWNMYGPTETTVWSSLWPVTSDGPILIGDPIDRTTMHVVTEALEEVPVGTIGELCIGGAGLTRGYRNRPELTRDRFVTLPNADGSRVYRTGDLARRRHDGGLEYLGRIDHQLKVGGHRIEPAEVEAALRRITGVSEAVVTAMTGALGLTQLVAYLVTEHPPDAARLRGVLGTVLPAYMVPTAYVALRALPLTPNGKVDRAALPPPTPATRLDETPPATPTEEQLHAMWQELFPAARFGVCEDFFDLGGHSRLCAHLLARIADRFGVRLPLAAVGAAPTVRALAKVIDDVPMRSGPLVELNRGRDNAVPLFLVHAAGGHALLYRDLARHLSTDVPVFVFQAQGLNAGEQPRKRVAEMATAYLRTLKQVRPAGPYLLGGASFGGAVAWEMATRLEAEGQEVPLLVLMDSACPPFGSTRLARTLTRLPATAPRYAAVRRLWSHVDAARRLGSRGYARWLWRGRSAARLERADHLVQQVGDCGADLLAGLLRLRDSHERAHADFVPRPYHGRVLFCYAADAHDSDDTRFYWSRIGRRIIWQPVPGNHGTMLVEPHVRQTAAVLRSSVTAAVREATAAASGATAPPLPPRPPLPVPA